ncbi:MAG: hypothetical protein JSV88_21690 [Candidatus Aminicenantes bacterium]|nr:MAG: hypothetical protein JSV88_21690 [Candidatus Aminicenantes bacterium]
MTKSTRTPAIGNEGLKYNFTYSFQMDMKGRILLVVPYRFYHEVSASVNFIARKNREEGYEFCFDGIEGTGYVMTTGGLTGTSLYFFTADYDLEKAIKFRENKIANFKKSEPYYAKNIRKIRRRPMKILSVNDDAIRFTRDSTGIHYSSQVNIRLTDPHSLTYSNIYKILGKMLNIYNHSFLPGAADRLRVNHLEQFIHRVWYSKPLDFSKPLEQAAKLTSEYAEKNIRFKQKQKFRMQYRITAVDNNYMEICGESYPDAIIRKKMKIRHVLRKIKLRPEDDVVVEDMINLDFRDKKARGGTIRLKLQLLL